MKGRKCEKCDGKGRIHLPPAFPRLRGEHQYVECEYCIGTGRLFGSPLISLKDNVEKITGDYEFSGHVVAKFTKMNGSERYVVENKDGILHIFSEKNLKLKDYAKKETS